ncbi:(deoxy)nucleoside triphosphate pyrophosphohydrolase [Angustibacter peucedani]
MRARRLVVGALLVDDLARPRRLLAARRTAPPSLAGGWELAGGKVEPDEPAVDALHRELREELAVDVRVGAELPGPDDGHWPISATLEMRVWWAELTAGEPAPDAAHDAVRWLDDGEWLDVAWLPADVPVVRAALDARG